MISNNWRQHRYQVQERDSEKLVAEYEADGMSHLAETEWRDRLKKSYPMKSASKEFEHCLREYGAAHLRDFRLIDTKTGRVIYSHISGVLA
jgi:hypothetical protein